MLFNVEADLGARILGYLVPDDFSGSPTVRVVDNGETLAMVPCNEERAALVAAGRHATGLCGFTIDETTVPGLALNDSLELRDAASGVLIYRRRNSSQVLSARIFRLETHLFPLWRLDDSVEPRFQFFHKGIERTGRETSTQVFLLNSANSLYLSGRLALKPYEMYVDPLKRVVCLQEPHVELAERLLTLKYVRNFGDEFLGARDMLTYSPAIDFAEALETDTRSLKRAFENIPKAVIAIFANPLTRQLVADSLDDAPPKGALAGALETLSTFAIVGLRERDFLFREQFENLLELPSGTLPAVPELAAAVELAGELRKQPEVELLLEQDIEIYNTVRSAVEQAL